jgi:hypothetical protein
VKGEFTRRRSATDLSLLVLIPKSIRWPIVGLTLILQNHTFKPHKGGEEETRHAHSPAEQE